MSGSQRIEDYAVIGDMQTAALVGRNGAIDWLCLPRFDSGACFAALLGDEDNGHWTIRPAGVDPSTGRATRRRYRGDTLVLETEWETASGLVRVIDFMPPRDEAPDIVRIVEGVSGRVDMSSQLRLRFDYGLTVPWVRRLDGQYAGLAGPDAVWLRTDVPTYGKDFSTISEFTVAAGDRACFVLTWHPSHLPAPQPVDPEEALERTESFWQEWAGACTYDGQWRDAVLRSLITLKLLTYAPTGGVVAAATTSLPEFIGGQRNWDYRYCWLRDATMTLVALIDGGYTDEARAWREWLLRAIAGSPRDLQIMYGVAGERRLVEYELDWLTGYEGSVPVRIGNAAVEQLQLDVYGEVITCLDVARLSGIDGDDHAWRLQVALLDFLEGCWQEPDEGLWEVRGPRQHFTHSKFMAWAAANRMVHAAVQTGVQAPVDKWRALRDKIHADVCEKAFDPSRNAFMQAYGSDQLDAATLLMPQVGFLPATDPRVVGTIEAVARELTHDGLVRRYLGAGGVDGMPHGEGTFLACSFWLATDLAMIGRTQQARDLFERLLDLRNDVGLLAEQYDPVAGRQLGNTPQAFSHVPLVNTAIYLDGGGTVRSTTSNP
jgi:GH15 family glucan-1,4-alpha-glucosidase